MANDLYTVSIDYIMSPRFLFVSYQLSLGKNYQLLNSNYKKIAICTENYKTI
jgi:hypothetical protein